MSALESAEQTVPDANRPRNPVRRWVAIILVLCIVIFGYSLIADRLTPYTPQGIVQAFVVAIAPEVPGRVIEVGVEDNQKAETAALLFRVDPEPYEIAVEKAMADVAAAGQPIGADTAGVSAAQAKVVEAQADLTNIREQTARTFELVKKGVFAKARGDQAQAQLDGAKAKLKQAQAERDLIHTAVIAPAPGIVTNLQLTLGQFATAGQPVMTFIDARDYWIVASFRENSLEHLQPGAAVDIVFDALPGQIFSGKIESVGWGVSNYDPGKLGDLPTIKNQSSWIRDPQRFPARIVLDAEEYIPGLRHGSQANVIVYTGDNGLVNAIGKLWIWLVSVLTYAT